MDRETKTQLLEVNYWHLFDLYRRGKFEQPTDSEKFQFYLVSNPTNGENVLERTLKPASDDLYLLACDLENEVTGDHRDTAENRAFVAELALRSKVLSYEIDDYFLCLTSPESEPKSKYFIQLSKEICDAIGIGDMQEYFEARYSFVPSREKQRKIIQYLLLGALCGINQLYRKHGKDFYRTGIERGEIILKYIQANLPSDSGFGLRGLSYYLLGRLRLANSDYDNAASDFRRSVENYSERVQVKDNAFKQKERQLSAEQRMREKEEIEVSRLVTMRRCALASAFGSAYLALVNGKVHEAVSLSALSRSILKQDCGEVYVAYTEFIYWSAKRAEASSNSQNLTNVRQGLRQCRRVFRRYVPDSGYVHRTGIQLGIVYHYLAKNLPESFAHRRNRYYELASAYISKARDFAGSKTNGRLRNQRLYAEAAVVLSHIRIHTQPEKNSFGMDRFALAEEPARRALEALDPNVDFDAAREIDQYICEAYLALGAVYTSKARDTHTEDSEKEKYIRAAREHIVKALEHNRGTNARIRATGYLRLADLSFFNQSTWPEINHFYQKWLEVKDSVEHDFLHEWAKRIKARMSRVTECLIIDPRDPRVSLRIDDWKDEIRKYVIHVAMRELAREMKEKNQTHLMEVDRKIRPHITGFLQKRCGFTRSDAYRKVKELELEELKKKLREYLS